jgi:hypothetical protein
MNGLPRRLWLSLLRLSVVLKASSPIRRWSVAESFRDRYRCTVLGHLLMTIGAVCSAQTALPNQLDLRAAYCRGYLAEEIRFVQSLEDFFRNPPVGPPALERYNVLLDRLKRSALRLDRYLLPRTHYLDMNGLALAAISGKEDYQLARDEVDKCLGAVEGCAPGGKNWESCQMTCPKQSPATQRTARCADLNFLPN